MVIDVLKVLAGHLGLFFTAQQPSTVDRIGFLVDIPDQVCIGFTDTKDVSIQEALDTADADIVFIFVNGGGLGQIAEDVMATTGNEDPERLVVVFFTTNWSITYFSIILFQGNSQRIHEKRLLILGQRQSMTDGRNSVTNLPWPFPCIL